MFAMTNASAIIYMEYVSILFFDGVPLTPLIFVFVFVLVSTNILLRRLNNAKFKTNKRACVHIGEET